MVPLGKMHQGGAQELLSYLEYSPHWPGCWVYRNLFYYCSLHFIRMYIRFCIYHTFNSRNKKDGVCSNSVPFLHPIPILVLSWQKRGCYPSPQFLSVSEWVREILGGEPSPLQLGPGHARFRLGKAGPGEAGWLCCFCQLWGLGQGSGPPVVSLIQHEHSHWVLTVSTGCCREVSDKWEMVFDLKDLTIYSEGITYTKNYGTGKMWAECHMTIHLLFQ